MIYRARVVVTMDGPPIEDGAVQVEGNRIRWAGRFCDRPGGDEVVDAGERVLLPGLINGHCHLDYTMMRNAISPQKSFARWIERLNAIKRSLDAKDYLSAIALGFQELKQSGVTTVLNIESFPELLVRMPPPPIRTWWFYEMIDVRMRLTTEDMVAGALLFFEKQPSWLGGFGLSPHSRYTASLHLFQMANLCAQKFGMPITTHVAESVEELLMFGSGCGELFDLVKGLGRAMHDCGRQSVVRDLISSGFVGPNWIFAHMNEIQEDEFSLLTRNGAARHLNVVHCPQSHRYFSHRPFSFQRLHELGANISLGTDSLASAESLNLFVELQMARESQPWLRAHELLRTVTINPARALQREGDLGCIRAGALADIIALPFSEKMESVYDAIIDNQQPVDWMMIDGRQTN
jgi:aminodeoxyfutalosine deaminase